MASECIRSDLRNGTVNGSKTKEKFSMSEDDRSHWEQRYKQGLHSSNPDPWVIMHLCKINRGRLLDVAAGEGALSVQAALLGFSVVALDIAPTAILRAEKRAKEQGVQIVGQCVDLDDEGALNKLGVFDIVVITKYNPTTAQWYKIIQTMRPHATLLLCSFNQRQVSMRPAFRLERAGLENLLTSQGLKLRLWEDMMRNGDHLAGSIWVKES